MTEPQKAERIAAAELPRALGQLAVIGVIHIALLLWHFVYGGKGSWSTPLFLIAYSLNMAILFRFVGRLRDRFAAAKTNPGASS